MSSIFQPDALKGKVALITGGATGIGRGIGELFLQHGARVAILGRRAEVISTTCQEWQRRFGASQCFGTTADVRSPEAVAQAVEQAVAHFGRLDILVNNAAGNFLAALDDISPKGFKTVLEIDLMGTFHASKAAKPHLERSGRGVIINISATLHYSATRYQGHASSAKAAVDALTRSIACEWAPAIRCNGVAPGPIAATEGISRLAPEGMDETIGRSLPLQRIGTVTDVAQSCLFLASDAASFITGHTLVVDGGAWVGQHSTLPPDAYEQIRASRAKL